MSDACARRRDDREGELCNDDFLMAASRISEREGRRRRKRGRCNAGRFFSRGEGMEEIIPTVLGRVGLCVGWAGECGLLLGARVKRFVEEVCVLKW